MDFYFFNLINQFAGRFVWLDGVIIFLADRFSYVLFGSLILFLIKDYKKYRSMVIKAVAAGPIAWFGISELIKLIWVSPRPFVQNQVNLLLTHRPDGSFPSSHASFFFAISTVVFFYNKKAGIVFYIASFLIGFSRVFVGIHWPSDILAGALVGIISGWLVNKIFHSFFKRGRYISSRGSM